MKPIDVGSACVKTAGREAGKQVTVTKIIDKNFVIIEGEGIKKRKCNIAHLFPIGKKMSVAAGSQKGWGAKKAGE